MEQIKYGDDGFSLRCDYPPAWDAETITDVEISVADRSGTELVAAVSSTLYTPTTLNADADEGAEYFQLAVGATALSPGQTLLIGDSDDGPPEAVVVHHYDATNRYVYGDEDLRSAHSSGAAVVGLFATYDLDVSDTDDYPKGKQIIVTWTPDEDEIPYTQMFQVSGTAHAPVGFWRRFDTLYPTEYQMATSRDLVEFEHDIRLMFGQELANRHMDVHRIVDQDRLMPGMVLYARWIILRDIDERDAARIEFVEWSKLLAEDPIWQDHDQDESSSASEVQTHEIEITGQSI